MRRIWQFHKEKKERPGLPAFQRVDKSIDTLADAEKGRDIFVKQIRQRTEVR